MIAANTATRWRLLANERPLAMALVAGLAATHIATITGYWFHGIGLADLQISPIQRISTVQTGVGR